MEAFELLSRRSDEHVAHEEGMVGAGANHADAYPVALVPTGESIDDVDAIPSVEVVNGTLAVDTPDLQVPLATARQTHVNVCRIEGQPPCSR